MIDFPVLNLQFYGSILPSFSDEIIGAILGASLAFLFSWILHRWAEKKSRALDLIQEYSSPEFIDIRNDAGHAIREEFDEANKIYPSWRALFEKYNNMDGGSNWRKISKMKHFFEKLNYMVSIREVNQKYVSGYFYNEFSHWNNRYFSKINNASENEQSSVELDVCVLEKYLKNPKTTRFFPFYITLGR
jgi:hypothetical protein